MPPWASRQFSSSPEAARLGIQAADAAAGMTEERVSRVVFWLSEIPKGLGKPWFLPLEMAILFLVLWENPWVIIWGYPLGNKQFANL